MARIIKVSSAIGDDSITLFLHVIRVYEEAQFAEQFAAAGREESAEARADAQFKLLCDSFAAWEAKEPECIRAGKVTGETGSEFFAAMDPADAERMATALYLAYQDAMQPKTVF